MRHPLGVAFSLLLAAAACSADGPPPGSDYDGKAFEFRPIRDGVYHAVGTDNLAVGCNGAVIVNDRDVLIVDSHMTPAAAWALRRELVEVTDKPIRYVVNTHFHFDHTHGNQIFGPEVEIIAHTFTRDKLVRGESRQGRAYETFIGGLPARLEQERARLATLDDGGEKEALAKLIAGSEKLLEADAAVVPTPPTVTLERSMTLHRGGREIRLIYFGRGHTGGDVVVYLPAEKVLVTGDLLTGGLPYMGDAYFVDWIDTLEAIKALDVAVILPGHGAAFEDTARIGHLQEYLREVWKQATALHEQGVEAADAVGQIDLGAHAEHFDEAAGPVSPHTIDRLWEILDGDS